MERDLDYCAGILRVGGDSAVLGSERERRIRDLKTLTRLPHRRPRQRLLLPAIPANAPAGVWSPGEPCSFQSRTLTGIRTGC